MTVSRDKRTKAAFVALTLAALCTSVQAPAQTNSADADDDRLTAEVLPSGINDLKGIDFKKSSIKNYYSTGRTDDMSKQVVFYNVGTQKFLNYGGYWGSHAALSNVPQVFWLQRHNDSADKCSLYDYMRYPESEAEQGAVVTTPKCYLTSLLVLNTVNVGSTEGSNRSNSTYKNICLVNADGTASTLRLDNGTAIDGYSPAGTAFQTGDFNIDFNKQHIEAEIDLSGCTASSSKLENLLTIGENIDNFDGGTNSKLHFYVWKEGNGYTLRLQNIIDGKYTSNEFNRKDIKLSSPSLKILLGAEGLFINGERVYYTSYTLANATTRRTTLLAASTQGDKRSHAKYSDILLTAPVRVADSDFLSSDTLGTDPDTGWYAPDGKPFKLNRDIDFDTQKLTAVIDLSTAQHSRNVNENIISIGSEIQTWQPKTAGANIHFYFYGWPKDSSGNYDKTKGLRLHIDATDKNSYYKDLTSANSSNAAEWLIPAELLTDGDGNLSSVINIELSADGLYIQGVKVEDTKMEKYINAILKLTNVQVGSCEGKVRSHAVYRSIKSERNVTGEKILVKSGEAGGGKEFKSESFSLGNYTLTATIDVSSCEQKGENLLSVGNDVDNFTTDDMGKGTLHFYYAGLTANGEKVMRIASASIGYGEETHDRYVKAADGVFSIALSADNLSVNGHTVYLADGSAMFNPPAYDASKAGDIVLFLTDADNHPITGTDGRYIIDSTHGKGFKVQSNSYLYVSDSEDEDKFNTFIFSNVQKTSSSYEREGQAMAWTPSKDIQQYGNIGVFIDRAIPENKDDMEASRELAQWTFTKVSGTGDNIYTISLHLNQSVTEAVKDETASGGWTKVTRPEGDKTYFLQADKEYIYSNNLADKNKGFYYNDADGTKITDITSAEAEYSADGTAADDNAHWKVFTLKEYYELFGNESSEMTSMLNLTFLFKDPNFKRENADLKYWSVEDKYNGTLKDKIHIGYDGYYKKSPEDIDYTIASGYKLSPDKKASNHARYMGVEAFNGARGRIYQDVKLSYPGWYAINCRGISNAGAKIFVQMLNDDGTETTSLTTPLAYVSDKERARLASTEYSTDGLPGWPYDFLEKTDGTHVGMPFYNALVDMNDRNLNDGKKVEEYTSQVAIYIDPEFVNPTTGKTKKLRFGIMLDGNTGTVGAQAAASPAAASARSAVSTDEEWTVFDNFQLLFGGNSMEPNLVIDEDSTSLDYLEESIHHYNLRPMHLKRTFSAGRWNTLMLPVSLTYSQFIKAFGDEAKLATLTGITASTIEFGSVAQTGDDEPFLKAMTPYIIYTKKASGDHEEYNGKLATRKSNGTKFIDVKSPDGHFYIENVTLAGMKTDDMKQPYYELSKDYPGYEAEGSRTDELNGIYLQSYGVICKTYEKRDGVNTIIEGRPDLSGGYVFKDSDMYRIKSKYGTKGLRCWFQPMNADGTPAPQSLKVVIDGIKDNTTGLDDLLTDDGQMIGGRYAEGIYNLNGQKIGGSRDGSHLPGGIYIVNGTKRVVGRR